MLFSYAGFKSHINFMPPRSSLEPFQDELAECRTGKDTIQIPHDQTLTKGAHREDRDISLQGSGR